MPGSVVAYYQQVGRAGALESAYGVLLSGDEEGNYGLVHSQRVSSQEVDDVLGALNEAADGLSIPELMTCVNMSKSRIEKTITALSLESPAPIAKQQTKWQLTAAKLGERVLGAGGQTHKASARRASANAGVRWPGIRQAHGAFD